MQFQVTEHLSFTVTPEAIWDRGKRGPFKSLKGK